MKAILIATAELQSPRFGKLVALLRQDDTPAEEARVAGRLLAWWCTWAGTPPLDCGVWLNKSLNEIGSWAAKNDGLKWGRALLAAEYVGQVRDCYPEPIASSGGYIALDVAGGAMIDQVISMMKTRAAAPELVRYIMNRRTRAQWADKLGVNIALEERKKLVPEGWYIDLRVEQPQQRQVYQPARDYTVVLDDDLKYEGEQQDYDGEACDRARAPQAAYSAPPAPRVVRVAGFASGQQERTAPPTSDVMLKTVREYKYSDPLRALRAMDASDIATRMWRRALEKDATLVQDELGKIVMTDGVWRKLRNPAAVMMKNLRTLGLLD